MNRPDRLAHPAAPLVLAVLLGGCMSAEEYRLEADEQVYALIEERREELFGSDGPFRVEASRESLRKRILDGSAGPIPPLDLVACLEIAAENSRTFQDRKERLFLTALDLTLEQWRFETQFGGDASATVTGTGEGAERADVGGGFSLSKLLGSGAQIVGSIGSNLFRLVSTGDGWDALSSVSLSFTQPLLRGAGVAIVREPLTQAERDLIYEVRSFERFRRTLAVDVASQVYRLVQSVDSVANEEANVERVRLLRERNEAMSDAGIVSDIEVDQALQDELDSQNRLLILREGLKAQFDSFKIFLGLPVNAELSIDPQVIDELRAELEAGDPLLDALDEELVTGVALANRLDYINTLDGVFDSERRIMVTEDALEVGLDFDAAVSGNTDEGHPFRLRSDDLFWSAGFTVDLPIDRLPERNAYRSTLISHEAALRSLEQTEDTIRADLRDLLRNVRTSKVSYELQVSAVTLAERRVESAALNLEAGRAETRDLLEAQRSLLANQNAATSQLIDYALARLELYLAMEALGVDATGIFVDTEVIRSVPEQP